MPTPTIQNVSAYLATVGQNEQRTANIGALNLFRADTPRFLPNANLLFGQYRNPVSTARFAVMKKSDPTITAARTLTMAADDTETAYLNVTWNTVQATIGISEAVFAGNDITAEQALSHELQALDQKVARTLDTAAIAALEAAKTQVDNSGGVPFTFAANTYGVTAAQRERFLSAFESVMLQNDFDGPYNILGSPSMSAYLNDILKYGTANDRNLAQFIQGNTYYQSNRLAAGAGNEMRAYVIPEGNLAVQTFIEDDCKKGIDTGVEKWYTMVLPFSDIEVGVYEKVVGADRSGDFGAGFERTAMRYWSIAFDIAWILPYNSAIATLPSAVHKFEISAT